MILAVATLFALVAAEGSKAADAPDSVVRRVAKADRSSVIVGPTGRIGSNDTLGQATARVAIDVAPARAEGGGQEVASDSHCVAWHLGDNPATQLLFSRGEADTRFATLTAGGLYAAVQMEGATPVTKYGVLQDAAWQSLYDACKKASLELAQLPAIPKRLPGEMLQDALATRGNANMTWKSAATPPAQVPPAGLASAEGSAPQVADMAVVNGQESAGVKGGALDGNLQASMVKAVRTMTETMKPEEALPAANIVQRVGDLKKSDVEVPSAGEIASAVETKLGMVATQWNAMHQQTNDLADEIANHVAAKVAKSVPTTDSVVTGLASKIDNVVTGFQAAEDAMRRQADQQVKDVDKEIDTRTFSLVAQMNTLQREEKQTKAELAAVKSQYSQLQQTVGALQPYLNATATRASPSMIPGAVFALTVLLLFGVFTLLLFWDDSKWRSVQQFLSSKVELSKGYFYANWSFLSSKSEQQGGDAGSG